ncbi:MAG: hypothetical protein HC859_06245 [Bacteroidia bacterium]|nr:hypothetical protein [Bacteroidia bacterium]
MLFRVAIAIVFTFASVKGYSQIDFPAKTSTDEYTPAAPTAAAMNEYGNIPVSYHTGIPNIEIPIFNVSLKDFTLPISLSYHAGGVRVDEVASRVGLGWTLNAGGSVTVAAVSKADDQTELWEMPPIPWSKDYNEALGYTYHQNHPELGYNFLKGVFSLLNTPNATGQNANFEPDDYSYNFGSYSGRFIRLNRDSNYFQTMPLSTLIIKDDYNAIDENGVEYFFDEVEVSGGTDPWTPTKTRYLTKVKTLEGDSIMLEYDDETFCYFTSMSQVMHIVPP